MPVAVKGRREVHAAFSPVDAVVVLHRRATGVDAATSSAAELNRVGA